MFDFTVNHTQKIQWNVELDHEGIDHHQVPQGHAPIDHALGGTPQHAHQGHSNDELLAYVQSTQGVLRLDTRFAQLVQVVVVTLGLKGFIAKILHGFIVQQGVDGAAVCVRIKFIDLLAKLGAPLGDGDREIDIGRQGNEGDDGVPLVKFQTQDGEDQHHFNQSGDDAVERIGNQRFNATHTALDVPAHAAGLPLEVKAQTESMQMLKGFQSDAFGRTLGGFGKHQFP